VWEAFGGGGETEDEPPLLVETWEAQPVREEPFLDARRVGEAMAGGTYEAVCWTNGDPVSHPEDTHDIWVRVRLHGEVVGYISGVYLEGDRWGDVPKSEVCH
jgi:hypothetical protein